MTFLPPLRDDVLDPDDYDTIVSVDLEAALAWHPGWSPQDRETLRTILSDPLVTEIVAVESHRIRDLYFFGADERLLGEANLYQVTCDAHFAQIGIGEPDAFHGTVVLLSRDPDDLPYRDARVEPDGSWRSDEEVAANYALAAELVQQMADDGWVFPAARAAGAPAPIQETDMGPVGPTIAQLVLEGDLHVLVGDGAELEWPRWRDEEDEAWVTIPAGRRLDVVEIDEGPYGRVAESVVPGTGVVTSVPLEAGIARLVDGSH